MSDLKDRKTYALKVTISLPVFTSYKDWDSYTGDGPSIIDETPEQLHKRVMKTVVASIQEWLEEYFIDGVYEDTNIADDCTPFDTASVQVGPINKPSTKTTLTKIDATTVQAILRNIAITMELNNKPPYIFQIIHKELQEILDNAIVLEEEQ